MKLGIAPTDAPTVLALALWPVFLILIGVLTFRLTRSQVLVVFGVLTASISWSYLLNFTNLGAEVIFLPLLLSFVLLLFHPPHPDRWEISRVFLATILLALILLTRYIALSLVPVVYLWWTAWRAKQRQFKKLVVEMGIFALAVLPIFLWLYSVRDVPRNPLSADYSWAWSTKLPLATRLFSFVKQFTWIALPSVRPGPVLHMIGWLGLATCLMPFLICIYLVWKNQPRWRDLLTHSPIVSLLIGYYSIFLVQPVYLMRPRYMSTALCLIQPLALSTLIKAPARWVFAALSSLILISVGLMAILTLSSPIPGWIQIWPPKIQDLADRNQEVMSSLMNGTPTWLLHRPPRLRDLENHHKDIVAFLGQFDRETPIVTNAPSLFPLRPVEHLSHWLTKPQCLPPGKVLVLIVDWDLWSKGGDTDWLPGIKTATDFEKEFEKTCPDVKKIQLDRGAVYLLRSDGDR